MYFALQTVAMLGILIHDVISGNLVFTDIRNEALYLEEITAYLNSIALPSVLIGAVIYFAIFIAYKLIRKHSFDFNTIDCNKLVFCLGIGLLLNIVTTIAINLAVMVVPESISQALNNSTSAALEGFSLWYLLLVTGICGPVFEELTFRYGMCGILARNNKTVGLIVSAVIFGLMHGNPIQIIYAAILGFIFGYVYLKHGNIWYPIMMHIAINSSSVLVSHFEAYWLYGAFGILAIVLILILLKKNPELKQFFAYSKQNVEQ